MSDKKLKSFRISEQSQCKIEELSIDYKNNKTQALEVLIDSGHYFLNLPDCTKQRVYYFLCKELGLKSDEDPANLKSLIEALQI